MVLQRADDRRLAAARRAADDEEELDAARLPAHRRREEPADGGEAVLLGLRPARLEDRVVEQPVRLMERVLPLQPPRRPPALPSAAAGGRGALLVGSVWTMLPAPPPAAPPCGRLVRRALLHTGCELSYRSAVGSGAGPTSAIDERPDGRRGGFGDRRPRSGGRRPVGDEGDVLHRRDRGFAQFWACERNFCCTRRRDELLIQDLLNANRELLCRRRGHRRRARRRNSPCSTPRARSSPTRARVHRARAREGRARRQPAAAAGAGAVDRVRERPGSVEVALGETRVLAAVTAELVEPYPDRAAEGALQVFADFSPMASPLFEPGRPSDDAVELMRLLERALRRSQAVDVEALCVVAGRRVWSVRCDVTVLDHRSSTPTRASRRARRAAHVPAARRRGDGAGDEATVLPAGRRSASRSSSTTPVGVTVGFVGPSGGAPVAAFDPTDREEIAWRRSPSSSASTRGVRAPQSGGLAVAPRCCWRWCSTPPPRPGSSPPSTPPSPPTPTASPPTPSSSQAGRAARPGRTAEAPPLRRRWGGAERRPPPRQRRPPRRRRAGRGVWRRRAERMGRGAGGGDGRRRVQNSDDEDDDNARSGAGGGPLPARKEAAEEAGHLV